MTDSKISFIIDKSTEKRVEPKKTYSLDFITNKINSLWGPSKEEILLFFDLFTVILSSSIPVEKALEILHTQTISAKMKRVIEEIISQVNNGESLSSAFAKHDNVFENYQIALISAGEKSGSLVKVLGDIHTEMQRSVNLRKSIKGMFTYSLILGVLMILSSVVVLLVIVPKMMLLFENTTELPLPTKILVESSNFLKEQVFFLIPAVVLFFAFLAFIKNIPFFAKLLEKISLRIPKVGTFLKQIYLNRFCHISGQLIHSGISIIEAQKIAAQTTGSILYEERILYATEDLAKGIELSENFSDDEFMFPDLMVKMIAVGEQTSSMGDMFEKIAVMQRDSIQRSIGMLSKLMEPIIIVVLALGVGFLVAAIYLPILEITDKFAN